MNTARKKIWRKKEVREKEGSKNKLGKEKK